MYSCEDCGSEFDEPKVISESRGEFWGAPAFENFEVCPECGSANWGNYVEQPRTVSRLENGKWYDIEFEQLREGDIVRIYDGDIELVDGAILVTSDVYYMDGEPVVDCKDLSVEAINKILEAYSGK